MSLLVGACTRGADIHYKTYQFISTTVYNTPYAQMAIVHSPYSAAHGQQKLFEIFRDNKHDHLLLLDCDVVPSNDAYQRMVAHKKDIVVAPVWFYDDESNSVFYGIFDSPKSTVNDRKMIPKNKGLDRMYSGGFGCMLISRKAIERFGNESFTEWSPLLPERFKHNIASDSIFWGKCYALGIEAYVDWSIETTHYRSVGLSNSMINRLRKGAKKK